MPALIIDDSEVTRAMLANILKALGFEVLEASDGCEGFRRLASAKGLDLALVDVFMPNMNGVDFVRAVRLQPEWNHIRLMMVTADNELGSVAIALEAGANEYLMKPFDEAMILEKLQLLGIGRC